MHRSDSSRAHGFFEQTAWGTVVKAREGDAQALERLVSRYREPILREIRARRRCRPEEAEDLAHDFIAEWLRRDLLQNVAPGKGLFRTYLKRCLTNFLCDRHDHDTAAKRGGGVRPLSLDDTEEHHAHPQPATPASQPGLAFDVEWAFTVLDVALNRLRTECSDANQTQLLETLSNRLGNGLDPATAAQLGQRLGISAGTVNVTMHRLRSRLGELIREEVRQTVESGEDLREELRYLMDLLGRFPRGSL